MPLRHLEKIKEEFVILLINYFSIYKLPSNTNYVL